MSNEAVAIAGKILSIREQLDELNEEEDLNWKRFFEICDDVAGTEQNYRVVVPEIERVIAREMHQASPKLLTDALRNDLTPKQWKSITIQTRVFDMTKLEEQIGKGTIDADLVNNHTERKPPVPHKKFPKATKKDLQEAS